VKDGMIVFMVETWVVPKENQEKHRRLWEGYLEYVRKNPELFKEMKSLKLFTQTFGTISGAIVEMIEFDSLADKERLDSKLAKDKESIKFHEELASLKDAATVSMSTWEPFM
jgi:uncharacterized protein with von Willebrand factor type A (vWA) domain